MVELVEYLVATLAPEAEFTVELIENDNMNDIIITISKSDIGKIIGKQGRIARAIRTLVKAGSSKSGIKYNVVIEENEN